VEEWALSELVEGCQGNGPQLHRQEAVAVEVVAKKRASLEAS
jgi:hypothetical protein